MKRSGSGVDFHTYKFISRVYSYDQILISHTMFQEHNLPTIHGNQHYAAIKLLTLASYENRGCGAVFLCILQHAITWPLNQKDICYDGINPIYFQPTPVRYSSSNLQEFLHLDSYTQEKPTHFTSHNSQVKHSSA